MDIHFLYINNISTHFKRGQDRKEGTRRRGKKKWRKEFRKVDFVLCVNVSESASVWLFEAVLQEGTEQFQHTKPPFSPHIIVICTPFIINLVKYNKVEKYQENIYTVCHVFLFSCSDFCCFA